MNSDVVTFHCFFHTPKCNISSGRSRISRWEDANPVGVGVPSSDTGVFLAEIHVKTKELGPIWEWGGGGGGAPLDPALVSFVFNICDAPYSLKMEINRLDC